MLELLDADGDPFAAYRYDEWGNPTGAGSHATGIWTASTSLISTQLAGEIASRQILRYASYAWDAESGLYYCSARYYDPVTRQFTTKDEVKADGEESACQYCGGDPVGLIDSTGRYTKKTTEKRSVGPGCFQMLACVTWYVCDDFWESLCSCTDGVSAQGPRPIAGPSLHLIGRPHDRRRSAGAAGRPTRPEGRFPPSDLQTG